MKLRDYESFKPLKPNYINWNLSFLALFQFLLLLTQPLYPFLHTFPFYNLVKLFLQETY